MEASGTSMLAPGNRQQLEASFKAFLSRPENRPLVEQHQQQEVQDALKLKEMMQHAQLQAQVLDLSPEYQKRLLPALQVPMLCQLLMSLTNGGQPLSVWLDNPRVMKLIRETLKALRTGRMHEQQLQDMLCGLLTDPERSGETGEETKAKQPSITTVPSHMLVEALNEHLSERRAGNAAYKQHQHQQALYHYERALSIVEFVGGSNTDDQAEIDANKVAVLLNMAAVHLCCNNWSSCVECCDKVLKVDAANESAWVRRCKANIGRHHFEAAKRDLDHIVKLNQWNDDAGLLHAQVVSAQKGGSREHELAARMLGLTLDR
eukprot:jgi/Chrzof1/14655/Cz09g10280.t1